MLKRLTNFGALLFFLGVLNGADLQADQLIDDAGQKLNFDSPPQAVVSVVPTATETLSALGVAKALVGVTRHDEYLGDIAHLPVVGGAFSPRFDLINQLNPDLVIVNPRDLEKARAARNDRDYTLLAWDSGGTLADGEKRIAWLGEIFNKDLQADELISENLNAIDLVAAKTADIAREKKLRTMRIMFGDQGLMTAGDDSFQSEIISLAGGIPPEFGPGQVNVTLDMWQKFNPEVVYDCDGSQGGMRELLKQEGWKDVAAVQNNRIYSFPCVLTDRAATHTGYFTTWLSSSLYPELFADEKRLVQPQAIVAERSLELDMPYVKEARVVESRIMDFVHKTLLIDFTKPQTIMTSEGGQREGIVTVGNSFTASPAWRVYYLLGFERAKVLLYNVLGLEESQTDLMYTGADMDNLVQKSAKFKDLTITALVTAGVTGNALRSSRDIGAWYEEDQAPAKAGTINILVLTNHKLSPKAMARAFITITEAKTAALWDMDIRSTQNKLENPATGTGTDSIIVVAGEGPLRQSTGGHSKMGELMAEVVYEAVQEAILKQNGKAPTRHIFHRLAERGLDLDQLFGNPVCLDPTLTPPPPAEWEGLLLKPRYAGFLEAALSLSDAQVNGQLENSEAFEAWALLVAAEIAGKPVSQLQNLAATKHKLPPVLEIALNALGTGLKMRDKPTEKRNGSQ